MRYFIKIVSLFIFTFISNTFAQPLLEIDGGNTYDWGTVKPTDSPLKAKIKIYNKGNETLKIDEVKPGCGCTTAPLDKDVIEPGEFATLDVTLNVGGASGTVNKNITIKSNNKTSQYTMLYIKAEIFRPVAFIGQNYFNYGDLNPGEEYERKVILRNNLDKEVKIVKIDKLPDFCTINIEEGTAIPAKGEIELVAKIKRTEPGNFNFSLKMQTDQAQEYDLFISGWGKVKEAELNK